MNLARISASGEITVPLEVMQKLKVKAGDNILFLQKQNGEIVVANASAAAIQQAQRAFDGVAEAIGVSDEDDVQALVDEVRYGNNTTDID